MDDVPLLSDVTYDTLAAGDAWGPFAEPLTAGTIDALGPEGCLPLVTLRVLRRALGGIPPGGVLVRQQFDLRGTIVPGDVDVDVRVTGQHERRGLHTTFAFALRQDGALVGVVDWTILAP